MNRAEILYLAPYLISLIVLLGVFLYSWQHRYMRGAPAFTWLVIGQTLTVFGLIFGLISPNLETKVFWNTFQWLSHSFLVILPFLIFATGFSDHKFRYPALTWGIVLGFLFMFAAIVLTDSVHHLFYTNPRLSTDSPFAELQYDFSFVLFIYVLFYVYGAQFYGIGLLVRRLFQPDNAYRLQYLILTAGFLIPLLFSFVALADIRIAPQRDLTPLALALGNLIVAWGLFRYGLFDIAPIARKQIVENMNDPVIVLDPKNRIVDINEAAGRLPGKKASEVIGHPFNTIFSKWPSVVELLNASRGQRRQVSTKSEEAGSLFDINIFPILNNARTLLGHIVVAHDITRHKTLQTSHRKLSEEVEQHVRERTEKLAQAAERYRSMVENQNEFIVRWKPDGTRTFVNEAYCNYWSVTYEQGIARNFLFHLHDEDRPAVEEKIYRLDSGITNFETEIHKVIKPDGSVGWQEWADHAVRDEWGQLIEIHSVGRDITERRQTETRLAGESDLTLGG
jgi:PAS domain S-box-containing protein